MDKDELELKQEELRIKKQELALKERESKISKMTNPLVVVIFAATLGLFGNLWIAHTNNANTQKLERLRTQSNIFLEAVKTNGDINAACVNLKFFVNSGLVDDIKPTIESACPNMDKVALVIPSLPSSSTGTVPAERQKVK